MLKADPPVGYDATVHEVRLPRESSWFAAGEYVLDRLAGSDRTHCVEAYLCWSPATGLDIPTMRAIRNSLRLEESVAVSVSDRHFQPRFTTDRYVITDRGVIWDVFFEELAAPSWPLYFDILAPNFAAEDLLAASRILSTFPELSVQPKLFELLSRVTEYLESRAESDPDAESMLSVAYHGLAPRIV